MISSIEIAKILRAQAKKNKVKKGGFDDALADLGVMKFNIKQSKKEKR
ncbi:MAG: hypothetical protein MK066_14020 [Crocinitomicaceae bacterium]|nr:hypothetical protein [Crocinitomicaceae bacterium]